MPLSGGNFFTFSSNAPPNRTGRVNEICINGNFQPGAPFGWVWVGASVNAWVPIAFLGQPIVTAPANYTLNVAAPANNATVSGVITFQIQAPGMLNVEVWNATGAKLISGTPDANGNLLLNYNTTALPNGSNSVIVHAWDVPAGQTPTHTATPVALTLNVTNGVSSLILPPAIAGQSQYSLTFADEFDSNSIMSSKDPTGGNWGTQFWYDPALGAGQSISVANSICTLSRLSTAAQLEIVGMYRPSATLSQRKGRAFKYGYFESKMRMTGNYSGNWPGFWLFSAANSGGSDSNLVGSFGSVGTTVAGSTGLTPEYDFVELYGDRPYDFTGTAHLNTNGGGSDGSGVADATNGTANSYKTNWLNTNGSGYFDGQTWHTFGGLWTPTTLSWWADGVQVSSWDISTGTWKTSWSDFMYPIFSLWNGTSGGTAVNGTAPAGTTFKLEIDYFRVWQDSNGQIQTQ